MLFNAPNRDASGLRRPLHDFQWIVNAVDSHDQIPFASVDVTRDQVLATPDASLRFTTYSSLVDMDAKMEGFPSLAELEKRQVGLRAELKQADERFGKAFEELKE